MNYKILLTSVIGPVEMVYIKVGVSSILLAQKCP